MCSVDNSTEWWWLTRLKLAYFLTWHATKTTGIYYSGAEDIITASCYIDNLLHVWVYTLYNRNFHTPEFRYYRYRFIAMLYRQGEILFYRVLYVSLPILSLPQHSLCIFTHSSNLHLHWTQINHRIVIVWKYVP